MIYKDKTPVCNVPPEALPFIQQWPDAYNQYYAGVGLG